MTTTPDTPQKLLTPNEAADFIGVDARTLRRWAAAGKLAAVRIGTKVTRYRPEDVESFIAANTSTPAASNPGNP